MGKWFKVPKVLATRSRAKELCVQAASEGADVLDFSEAELVAASAMDTLLFEHDWIATTGESEDIRARVVRALQRRGALPLPPARTAESTKGDAP